jgi:predicted amidohydrolase
VQFPVGADIRANLRHVKAQMGTASERGARVAHFPEGALAGYAGTDFEDFASFDWDRIQGATEEVLGRTQFLQTLFPARARQLPN